MKKIGIITINDNINYGNRLQNLAVELLLESMGFEAHTITNTPYEDTAYIDSKYLKKSPSQQIKALLKKSKALDTLNSKIKKKDSAEAKQKKAELLEKRRANFEKFNNMYLHIYPNIIEGKSVPDGIDREFDLFAAGSDQVWNPSFKQGNSISYLQFAPKEKRISLAASFGTDRLEEKYINQAKHYLEGMNYISVREESGRKIVKELTGRDCDLMPDPTLLVNPKVWHDLSDKSDFPVKSRYVLTFFLGAVSPERAQCAKNFAKEKGLDLICLNDVNYPEYFTAGPEDFLKLIKNADYVFTDSFHASVFSVIFKRQFFAFGREGTLNNMSGRLYGLFKNLQLGERFVEGYDRLPANITSEQYQAAHRIIDENRATAINKLRCILNRDISRDIQ